MEKTSAKPTEQLPTPLPRRPRHFYPGALSALFLLVVFCYGGTLRAPFYFDDYYNIINNTGVHLQGLSPGGLWRAALATVPATDFPSPLFYLSLGLNYWAGGLDPWSYHLVILDIMGVRGFDLLNAAVSLGFPTVMLTAHALSLEDLKKSIEMGARAFLPKEKMVEILPFLEDVIRLGYKAAWLSSFERLGGFFGVRFGKDWHKHKKKFLKEIESGDYKPTILKSM